MREFARALGISRSRTLKQLVASGLVRTVPWRGERRIPRDEFDRLIRDGIPQLDSGEPRPAVVRPTLSARCARAPKQRRQQVRDPLAAWLPPQHRR